ncbi:MAG: amidohydrolase family protein [Oscillospiraceae bacterium]|nr:amidohydrolase family protein [Oscillospiraceae bacterium]
MRADCHMHMILDGYEWKSAITRHKEKPDEAFIRQVLETYQKLGYTYLRDGGDRWNAGKRSRELAGEYGITYRTPLAPLCKKGHYGAFIGLTWETFAEYRDLVVKHRQNGADFIKIMISGLMDFDHFGVLSEEPLEPWEIRELIHIAHEEGFAVMSHCNGARTAEAAAAAGVDSIDHGAYLDADALQTMEDNGTVWVPTLSTIGNLRGKGRFNEDAVRKILDSALENISRYNGLLAAGTDAGAWAVPHGSTTEEGYFAMAGVGEDRLAEGFRVIQRKF